MTNTIRKIAICLIPAILTATGLFALNTDAVAKTEIVEPLYVSSAPAITEAVYTEVVKEATDTAPVVEQTEIPAEIEQIKTEGFVKSSSARIDPVVEAPVKEKNTHKDNAPAPVAEQTVVDAFVITETVNGNNSASFSGDGSASVPVTATVEPTEEYSDPVRHEDLEYTVPVEITKTPEEMFDRMLEYIPSIVKDTLYSAGLDVSFTNLQSELAGQCLAYREKGILTGSDNGNLALNTSFYAHIDLDKEPYDVFDATIHEFGHALAGYCSTPYIGEYGFIYFQNADATAEWLDIYAAENGNTMMSDYGRSDPIEYFAESFMFYCLDLDAYRDCAPKS